MFTLLLACTTVAPSHSLEPDGADPSAPPISETPDSTADPEPNAEPDPTEPTPPEPEPEPAPACSLGAHDLHFTLEVQHGGRTRTALVDLPATYDGTEALPTALNFHGLLMNAGLQRSYTHFDEAANDRGMIAVHPNGLNSTWDVTPWTSDVGFVDALLDALAAEVCVDPDRTYATGLSMGGYFSYTLGCQLPGRFAAIAPVAGLDANVLCNPGPDMPLLHLHGTADFIVPYGGSFPSPSAPAGVDRWARQVNGCDTEPVVTFEDGEVTCETWSCGGPEATLCTIQGGGHLWPGANPIPLFSDWNDALDANTEILDFFEDYTR
ncbi:MAG: alpha/beta hydrolase-fold protein [Myxococcota bacterium]